MRLHILILAALLSASVAASLGACAQSAGDEVDAGLDATPFETGTSKLDSGSDSNFPAPDASAVDGALPDAAKTDSSAGDAAVASSVVVNEVYAADVLSKRYVELAGPAGMPLRDLALRIVNSNGVVLKYVTVAESLNDVMPARGTWIVGGIGSLVVDHGLLVSEWDLPSDNGSVQLVNTTTTPATLLDVVGYGAPALSVQTAPTSAVEIAAAPSPSPKTLLRKPGFVDTGNNSKDFCLGSPSPHGASICD